MKPRYCVLALLVVAGIGCGGYSPGDVYEVRSAALYPTREAFDEARSLKNVGEQPPPGEEKPITVQHAKVKIIENTTGGAKVIVKDSDHIGKIGWMLADELSDRTR